MREAALPLLSVPRFASNLSSRIRMSPVLQGVRLLRLWATGLMREWGRPQSKGNHITNFLTRHLTWSSWVWPAEGSVSLWKLQAGAKLTRRGWVSSPEGRISLPEASGGSFRSLLFREGPFRQSGFHSGSVDTLSRYGDSEPIPVPLRPSPSRNRTFWLCYLRSRDLTRGGGEPLGWGKLG